MMTIKTTHYRKPDLLLLLAFVVGVSFLATTVAQAAEPADFSGNSIRQAKSTGSGWLSIPGLQLVQPLKNRYPKISLQALFAKGLDLAHPFGKAGPGLQLSSSLPASVRQTMRASGDSRADAAGNDTDVYIFLQKRW